MTPLFSVIVPTFNRLDFLREALASVWAQTFADYEVVVIDDGSTDGTSVWLRREPRLRLLRQANRGPGAARNLGSREARGEYLAFLDCDDLWFPWTLRNFAEAIDRHDRPSLVLGVPLEFEDGRWDQLEGSADASLECEFFRDYLASNKHAFFVGTNVCVVNRDRFLSTGGFVETLRNAEDIDLFLRMGMEPGFVQIRKPHTLGYRRHVGGLTTNYHAAVAGVSFLIEGERIGRYPGGRARARERREIIARSVRSVSVAAIKYVSVRAAATLYWKTLDWHLLAWRIKYLAGFWAFVMVVLLGRQYHRAD